MAEVIFIYLGIGAVFGTIGWAVGESKDQGPAGFGLGFLLGPLGVLIAVLLPPTAEAQARKNLAVEKAQDRLSTATERKCPFCAELIKSEAVICRFCNRDVPPSPRASVDPRPPGSIRADEVIMGDRLPSFAGGGLIPAVVDVDRADPKVVVIHASDGQAHRLDPAEPVEVLRPGAGRNSPGSPTWPPLVPSRQEHADGLVSIEARSLRRGDVLVEINGPAGPLVVDGVSPGARIVVYFNDGSDRRFDKADVLLVQRAQISR